MKRQIPIVSLILFSLFSCLSATAEKFCYTVEWGGNRIVFTSVSGLDQLQLQLVNRRSSITGDNHMQAVSVKSISMKGGNCKTENEMYKWFGTSLQGAKEKRDVTIKLLNSNGEPVKTWKVHQAFPVKVEGPTLNAKGTDVAIETVVLTYEGIEPE
jgi:phage tail-like protein